MDTPNTDMPHIGEEWTEERLNESLVHNYGYDLFDFALSLGIVLRKKPPFRLFNIWRLKRDSFEQLDLFRYKVARLERIRDSIVQRLERHLDSLGYWRSVSEGTENQLFPSNFPIRWAEVSRGRPLSGNEKRRIVRRLYNLDQMLEVLESEIEHYRRIFRLLTIRHPGRQPLPKTIIFSLWSYVLRRGRTIHLMTMVDLVNWFLARIGDTSYGRRFSASVRTDYPGSEEISRFKRNFARGLQEDLRELFHHNYRESPLTQKPRILQVRFERSEPKFYRIEANASEDVPLIVFPH
jgi:hypothetical protein